MKTLYDFMREEFEKEVGSKTGWGKNEVMAAFDKAVVRALYRYAAQQGVSLD
jgi:hypothetical protein